MHRRKSRHSRSEEGIEWKVGDEDAIPKDRDAGEHDEDEESVDELESRRSVCEIRVPKLSYD